MRTSSVLVILLLLVAPAAAESDLDHRARILAIEMRRGPAEDLAPYLRADAAPRLRHLAIRALGRIGNRDRAPELLADVIDRADGDLVPALWAAGISRAKALRELVAAHLSSKDSMIAGTAAASLGWIGGDEVGAKLAPLLESENPVIRGGALVGLARMRDDDRGRLAKVVALAGEWTTLDRLLTLGHAQHAAWLMAGAWRAKARKADPDWDGEPELCMKLLHALDDDDPRSVMGAIRPLGILLPKHIEPGRFDDAPFAPVFALVRHPDARVVQDLIWRVLGPRKGTAIDDALKLALEHDDPEVRTMAAEALGEDGVGKRALARRFALESDARVRETLAIELARLGEEDAWKALQTQADARPADPVVRQRTDAQVLLVSKRKNALDELFTWADPGASQRTDLHAAVWMGILSALEGREHPKLEDWLMGFMGGGYAVDRDERPYVIASALGLVGANKLRGLWKTVLDLAMRADHEEVRLGAVSALAALMEDDKGEEKARDATKDALLLRSAQDPSPWVRRAAFKALQDLGVVGKDEVPEDDEGLSANTWRGLPAASAPIEGVDPPDAGDWLDEKQILEIADWMRRHRPLLVFETTQGSFTVELDPESQPVHSVSLFNAVRNGVYTKTRWHRVVPNFVIQGGDPHGHGAGGGGWTVPDEIDAKPYVRGALGMPKSTKDDGGCQIFVMHTLYHPLDERYTNYGRVVSGMDVVDRIRVGDRIRRAYVRMPQ